MAEVSIFKGFNKVVADREFTAIAETIRNGTYRKEIDKLRNLLSSGKEKEYSEQKKKLPAFTPSGKYEGGRKPALLQSYTGIIVLDVDKTNEQTAEIKNKATHILYTYCCFISPGGNGLKIFVRVNSGASQHLQYFNVLKKYYEKCLNIEVDPSGKDITRLCFLSSDPELYLNPDAKVFTIKKETTPESDIEKLVSEIESNHIDITSNYEDWCNVGFALENEFGEGGRQYFHNISRFNPEYNSDTCNEQYTKCLNNRSTGITIKTLFHLAKQHGVVIRKKPDNTKTKEKPKENKEDPQEKTEKKITSNKFTITEEYLHEHFVIRYNVVSNKFEYKAHDDEKYKDLNENNLYIRLQKDNVNISLNNLIALLKSDFVTEYNPFLEYFKGLPEWDGQTDYIKELSGYLKTPDRERLDKHFKKWLVRTVKSATDDFYYNKQAFVLVSTKQNSGKSTYCRFLCPPALMDYIVENIGTDKDSLVAITENFLINLDELSTAEKAEINAFKSMFSKDKIKARLTYDKRASVHVRRASFIGSTDRWEFLTDENGSVRWLCFDITEIDWSYS
ncbi:MAG: PriCT-2 domain-containing protein, partial [Proteobacteria bacterium]|nr:PriCT-2 domain-containing protein [Pseudomonadota bacterium]